MSSRSGVPGTPESYHSPGPCQDGLVCSPLWPKRRKRVDDHREMMPPPDQRTREVSRRLISTQYESERGKCQTRRPHHRIQASQEPTPLATQNREGGRESLPAQGADHRRGWTGGPQASPPASRACTQEVENDPDRQGPWVGVAPGKPALADWPLEG